jgi:hypothetical protein
VGKWSINLYSPQAEEIFMKINVNGVKVFKQQLGFISYRLMRASADVSVAVAEWESRELGEAGAKDYRKWLRKENIWEKLVLETYDGDVVASS